SGDTFLAQVVSFAMRDNTGALTQRASICRDVTDEQRLRRSLIDNEQRLQMLLNGLPVMLFATDLAGTITLSEGRDLAHIGIQPGEAVGQSIFAFYKDIPEIIPHVERALSGEELTFEIYYPSSEQYFERYFAPLKDTTGTITGMMGLAFNITDRKQSAQALEAERSRLQALYEAVPDIIARYDRQGTYLDYKPAGYFSSSFSPEEIIGKTLKELAKPEIAEQRYTKLNAAFKTGEMQTSEMTVVIKGEARHRETRMVKLNDNEVIAFTRDITDLKRSEATLHENQQLLEDAQSMGKLGGWSFDLVTQELYWSKQIYDISEVSYDTELTVELAVSVYVDPAAIENAMANTIETHEPYDVELEIITLKGNRRWVRSIGKPVVEDGKVVKLVGIHQDITDMKQVQAQLLENQQFLEDAQSMGKLGGWSFDLVTQELYWSKQVYDISEVSYDTELTVELAVSVYVDPAAIQAAMNHTLETHEPYDVELEIITPKGNRRWTRSIGKPVVEDGKVVKLVGIHQDITDMKQVQAQLLESQQFLEDAQSMGKLGGWSFDVVTQAISWSKQVYETMEAPYDSELTTPFLMSFYKDTTTLQNAMAAAINNSKAYDLELEITTLQGNHRWVRAIGKPVLEDGKVVKLVGTQQDITDMKQVQAQLLESQQFLEDAQSMGKLGGWSFDLVTQELYWSKQIYDICETPYDQELSVELATSLYVDSTAIEAAMANTIETHEPYDVELEIITLKGNRRWTRSIGKPIVEDSEVVKLVGTYQDITDTKQVEAQLLESQQFLEDAQSMGKLGGWSFDLVTQELYWSKQIYDISEVSHDTELTVELAVSLYVDPAAIESAMANTIKTHEPYDVELEIITLKGNYRWVRSIGKPVVEDGKVVKLVGIHQDITDMKQAELGLQVANDNLARLNTLSDSLNRVETIDEMLHAILEPLPADTIASVLYPVYDDQKTLAAFELAASYLPSDKSTVQPGTRYPIGAFPSMDTWLDSPDSVLIVEDIANDTTLDSSVRTMHVQLGFASLVFMALTQADDVISIVGFYWRDKHVFSDDERAYLSALSSLLAPVAANRQLLANLEETVTKRSEELARSRQLLRATIDNAPLIVSVKDTQFCYILANNNIGELVTHASPKDVIGRDDFELLPEAIAQDIRRTDVLVRDTKKTHAYEASRTNGKIYYVNKFPMIDKQGELFAIGLVANDITEQREKEREVQAYRDQLSQAQAELQITQRIQELLLPADDELAAIRNLDIASYMKPAEQVGGDYYDIMQLGDTVRFGIGDVTGHGLESGLLMLMTQTAVRTLLSSGEHDPKRIMNVLNKTVFDNLERMQVDKSLTLSLLDYEQGQLRLSGQHEYVLIIREGGQVETIDTMDLGMPLGLEADISQFIAEKTLELNPGEGVVLFTDGITEAENDSHEQFGLTKLTDLIQANWQQPAQGITDAITRAVYDHVDGHTIYDDITLVVFKRPTEDDLSVLAETAQPQA
ncbi:MAG: PAS domain S-box protein, partial [Deinococcota bacterium]